jgi:simple sugar transport system permease protein
MMRRLPHWEVTRRQDVGSGAQVLSLVIALAGAAGVTAVMLRIAGGNARDGFLALYQGSFGSWDVTVESLVKATPLILTGLATTIAFRGRIWNIGQEGQLYAGAMAAYWAYATLGWLPPVPLLVVILLAAMAGGALCGLVTAVIKVKAHVDEIITTIMLNYIVVYVLSFLLSGPWRDPSSYYQQSSVVAEAARFPAIVPGSRLHIGFLVGVVAAFVIQVLLDKTSLGFEIRAIGLNPTASQFQGISIARTIATILLISGGLAGLAGAGELFGNHYRLKAGISLGFGYTGIIIAMLGGLHPLGVILAAIFFGGLINGSFMLQIVTGVPSALVSAIQAVVLLFLLGARAAVAYRVRVIRDA